MSRVCTTTLLQKWLPGPLQFLISTVSAIVFTFLDFLDVVMCMFYGFLDEFLEGKASSCYCMEREDGKVMDKGASTDDDDPESELSETLHRRKNIFRQMGLINYVGYKNSPRKIIRGNGFVSTIVRPRWSDCVCDICVERMSNGSDLRLHFVVKEPSNKASLGNCEGHAAENVIFLHGFLSSSSFWAETVFPNISESVNQNYRLLAVDLLGFGKSPKPQDCLYTMRDHLEMIEKSVIRPFQLSSFHLVAHSMGCLIAFALAAKFSESVKTITLIAPPYIYSKEDASLAALNQLAPRRVWPPLLFGSSSMSWYEHLGRCVCFLICRNHKTWERILKLLTGRRNLHFLAIDLTRHTHHSAWHTMHNVICGGAKLMDRYLEVLNTTGVKIRVVHGTRDQVVPVECSTNIKMKVANAQISKYENADHWSVIIGREREFTKELEHIWAATADSITK